MLRRSSMLALVALTSLVLLTGATKGGCGQGLDNRPGDPGIDVGGPLGALWNVQYSKTVEVVIKQGGAVVATQNVAVGVGATFDLGGVKVDLDAYCAREDVVCPYDVFPDQVKMTQPGSERHLLYVQYKPKGPLAYLENVTLLGNVDSDDDFSIALGISGAAAGACGLLGVSYATGHIQSNGDPIAPLGLSLTGDIVTAYAGGCLVGNSSGGAAAGLTVELRVPFDGVRR